MECNRRVALRWVSAMAGAALLGQAVVVKAQDGEQERLARRLNDRLDQDEAQRRHQQLGIGRKDDGLEGLGNRVVRGFQSTQKPPNPEAQRLIAERQRREAEFAAKSGPTRQRKAK